MAQPTLTPREFAKKWGGQNLWVFIAQSTDLRFLGPALLPPAAAPGYPGSGYPAAILALGVGYGPNVMNAISVGDRIVLNNGSHRAYALLEAGVTQVPCVIQTVTHPEQLTVVAQGPLAEDRDRYLTDPRPPMLRDYFEPRLRTIVPVPRKVRQIRLQFAIEQIDVPAQT